MPQTHINVDSLAKTPSIVSADVLPSPFQFSRMASFPKPKLTFKASECWKSCIKSNVWTYVCTSVVVWVQVCFSRNMSHHRHHKRQPRARVIFHITHYITTSSDVRCDAMLGVICPSPALSKKEHLPSTHICMCDADNMVYMPYKLHGFRGGNFSNSVDIASGIYDEAPRERFPIHLLSSVLCGIELLTHGGVGLSF